MTERLLYPNVFGIGTAVQYTPTLTGVKEEILLARNTGKSFSQSSKPRADQGLRGFFVLKKYDTIFLLYNANFRAQ